MSVFSITNFSLVVAGEYLLKNASFKSHEKRICISGKSGIGKSSFLRALLGIIPFYGEASVLNFNLPIKAEMQREYFSKVAPFFQVPRNIFHPLLNIERHFKLTGNKEKEEAIKLLNELGLKNPRAAILKRANEFSGGEIARIALAIIILRRAELLMLDEISANLDALGKKIFINKLREIDSKIILFSHDVEFSKNLCDEFITFSEGKLERVK